MTYRESGGLPLRVKAIVNVPKTTKVCSLVIYPDDYEAYQGIETIHALAAWQLATRLAWLYGEEDDLIPAKIHRIGTTGVGYDVTIWTLSDSITAKRMLASGLSKTVMS